MENQKMIMSSKLKPQWVKEREALQTVKPEELIIVGQMGVAGVIDGKLPNGELYSWYKRRGTKDTKYKGRKV